jgi:galactonate dehydratase
MMLGVEPITCLEVHVASTSFRNLTLVKLTTDTGLVGWGDATLAMREHAVVAHLRFLEHLVRGADALAPAALWQTIVDEDFFMRDDIVGRTAVSGVMVACADIAARALNVPTYRLLGGPVRNQVPAYANGWFRGDRTPETAALCARAAVAKGYRALKFDPFGPAATLARQSDLRDAVALVEAVREEVGPEVEIYVDAHGRFTFAMARRAAELLAESRIGFLEEPLAPTDFAGMRKLRELSPVPIAAGERSTGRDGHRPLIEGDCVDIVQPDIAWSGGIFEVQQIARWADTHGMLVAVHNFASPIATAAGCHVGMSLTNFLCQEIFEDFDEPWVVEAFPSRVSVRDGFATVPEGPGLAVEPDEDLLGGRPLRPIFHRLRAEGWESMDGVLNP